MDRTQLRSNPDSTEGKKIKLRLKAAETNQECDKDEVGAATNIRSSSCTKLTCSIRSSTLGRGIASRRSNSTCSQGAFAGVLCKCPKRKKNDLQIWKRPNISIIENGHSYSGYFIISLHAENYRVYSLASQYSFKQIRKGKKQFRGSFSSN